MDKKYDRWTDNMAPSGGLVENVMDTLVKWPIQVGGSYARTVLPKNNIKNIVFMMSLFFVQQSIGPSARLSSF